MPECFLETNLVEVLLEKANSVNHKKGNSNIASKLNSELLKDSFAVAIIDDDKRRLKELDNCTKNERLSRKGLKFFKRRESNHYFIQVSPAMERWILNECTKGGISMTDYNLPDNLDALRGMKGVSQRTDDRFKRLFSDMLKNESCDEIIELKRWLLFLKENNYNSDLDLL